MSTRELLLTAPLAGPLLALTDVPDPVFSEGLMGPGIAIDPLEGQLFAPCAGEVIQIARSAHAITLRHDDGYEVFMHVGLDTVQLKGQGFQLDVHEGDRVSAGQLLLRFDLDTVAQAARSLISMMTVTNAEGLSMKMLTTRQARVGEPLLILQGQTRLATDPDSSLSEPHAEGSAMVAHSGGLHARPAALLREAVQPFSATTHILHNHLRADAASLVSLLKLGVKEQQRVMIECRGQQAVQALAAAIQALEHPAARVRAAASLALVPASLSTPPKHGEGVIQGICASPGLAMGPLWKPEALTLPAERHSRQGAAAEQAELDKALQATGVLIQQRIDEAQRRGQDAEAAIFTAHLALLDDPELLQDSQQYLNDGLTAAHAWHAALERQCQILAGLDNLLLRERISDLRDVQRQVLRILLNVQLTFDPPRGALVAADDLSPSELTNLLDAQPAGLCLAGGGATSHVSILARAAGLPCVVALGESLMHLEVNVPLVLDASAGRLETAPDSARLTAVELELRTQAKQRERLRQAAQDAAITRDGQTIEVAANVSHLAEARRAQAEGADGIGLLRTELLFMDRTQAPTQQEQRSTYQAMLEAFPDRPVIIRTLDIGGDKPVDYLSLTPEPNPALGLRGIRLGWTHPQLLDDQLKALLQVQPVQRCRVLLPMISEVGELLQVRQRIRDLAAELNVPPALEVGVMIEVPSAALLAEQLAAHADFFSIGTNDLTQYTLAMDRCHSDLAAHIDALHPSVLRLIAQACAGARRHGKWVGVCGDLASDSLATPVLIGLGISELSVGAARIGEIKARVRQLEAAQCRQASAALLDLPNAQAVRARCEALWPVL
ncbi:phosphoenolpyruvate--protein phosphotransferase [Pseudomonas asuensis]|uniref:phosphoenolpyruvate--protein phosphotransferase n=1 Tax=Pseudomonas asuensis TaxID=1825787 RepID=A0ABQ2GRA2_9PSED|nr:phosphoenolpyruvate--protein phosphotransferase [Pseudomonas asuensis]GGM09295.1 phosphoenolpyruvate--protein phosphotransferase [Pseudomonas asuensis]